MIMIINRKITKQIAGRPVTTQRSLLLDIIRKTNKHLDADELYRIAKEKEPRISLATIYRNLKLFKELGLIAESSLGDTHSHYEVKSKAEHHHMVCLGCGKIVEFDSPLITKAADTVKKEKGFDITSIRLRIEGYCPECKQEKK
jgi:Fur family ferric uptake transcriptional regulator